MKIKNFFKGKFVIISVALITFIVGGVGGFFIGQNRGNTQQTNLAQRMSERFGNNGGGMFGGNGGNQLPSGANSNSISGGSGADANTGASTNSNFGGNLNSGSNTGDNSNSVSANGSMGL